MKKRNILRNIKQISIITLTLVFLGGRVMASASGITYSSNDAVMLNYNSYNMKSKGVVNYKNGTTVSDAADVKNIAASVNDAIATVSIGKKLLVDTFNLGNVSSFVDIKNALQTKITDSYNSGYAVGKLEGKKIVNLGSGTQFDVSGYEGYQSFTASNFIVETTSMNNGGGSGWRFNAESYGLGLSGSALGKNYNASSGILSVTGLTAYAYVNGDGSGSWQHRASTSAGSSFVVYLVY